MAKPAFASPDVARAFAGFPREVSTKLAALRKLILRIAAETEGVGPIEETLKWGQPSYLTPETGSGSTIRLGVPKAGGYAIYFHCQSGLVPAFRALYGDVFRYDGKRALLFAADETPPAGATAHCIAMALTHHLDKRKRRAG